MGPQRVPSDDAFMLVSPVIILWGIYHPHTDASEAGSVVAAVALFAKEENVNVYKQ